MMTSKGGDSSNLRVGQKVVCIGDKWRKFPSVQSYPVKDQIYTIRSLYSGHGVNYNTPIIGLYLVEIRSPIIETELDGLTEVGWIASAFRPLITRKTDISVFTRILDKVPSNVL